MNSLVNTLDNISRATIALFSEVVWPLLRTWWWVAIPLLTFEPAKDGWLLWRQTKEFREREYILLEFILPHDIIKPIKAMEDVFSSLYSITFQHAHTFPRERWIDGQTMDFSTFSLEIVGDSGKIRFFMRMEEVLKDQVSSIIHAQYPDLEIREVEDYTKQVPQDVPNEEWELECRNFKLAEGSSYPLKTYREFFEEHSEAKEEKRVDPLARLFESFSRLNEGEQIWIQFNLTNDGQEWKEEAKKLRDKLAKRTPKEDSKQHPMLQEITEFVLLGKLDEGAPEKERPGLGPDTTLTPGEKEIVADIDRKISKAAFKCSGRFIYLAKRENMYKPHMGFPFAFTSSLSKGDQFIGVHSGTKVNSLIKIGKLDKQKAFLRKRVSLKNYQMRVNPTFPETDATFVLNAEELATMYHFPGQMAAPGPAVERSHYKKSGPPPGLPME